MRTWRPHRRGFDVAACIGARPWDSTVGTLEHLRDRVHSAGAVVIGEGYWRQPPDAAYLEMLGCEASEYRTLSQTLALGEGLGLELVFWQVATVEAFDSYERTYVGNLLDHGRAKPRDLDAQVLAMSARKWRNAYLQWGRDTLGFVVAAWKRVG